MRGLWKIESLQKGFNVLQIKLCNACFMCSFQPYEIFFKTLEYFIGEVLEPNSGTRHGRCRRGHGIKLVMSNLYSGGLTSISFLLLSHPHVGCLLNIIALNVRSLPIHKIEADVMYAECILSVH